MVPESTPGLVAAGLLLATTASSRPRLKTATATIALTQAATRYRNEKHASVGSALVEVVAGGWTVEGTGRTGEVVGIIPTPWSGCLNDRAGSVACGRCHYDNGGFVRGALGGGAPLVRGAIAGRGDEARPAGRIVPASRSPEPLTRLGPAAGSGPRPRAPACQAQQWSKATTRRAARAGSMATAVVGWKPCRHHSAVTPVWRRWRRTR